MATAAAPPALAIRSSWACVVAIGIVAADRHATIASDPSECFTHILPLLLFEFISVPMMSSRNGFVNFSLRLFFDG
jgi:hypothetical protein